MRKSQFLYEAIKKLKVKKRGNFFTIQILSEILYMSMMYLKLRTIYILKKSKVLK